jgi:subtilisin family serine protease
MTLDLELRTARWILAGALAVGAVVAHAAAGYSVTESQEGAVKVGMSTTEVQQILGHPARIINYPYAPGPTWTYRVLGPSPFGMTEFDVAFGSDGKVSNVSTQIIVGVGR